MEEAEAYESSSPFIEYNLALAYAEANEPRRAYEKLNGLAGKHPFFAPLWSLRVLLCYEVEGHDACVRMLEEAERTMGRSEELRWERRRRVRGRMARCRMERCEHAFKEAKGCVISCVSGVCVLDGRMRWWARCVED